MSGAQLFTPATVAQLAAWQIANMPDRAFLFGRSSVRQPGAGGVPVDVWTFVRVDACRLSLSRSTERNTEGTLGESRAWTLARPVDAPRLDGTERILVQSYNNSYPALFVRVSGADGARTFQTVQRATVTTDGVDQRTIVGTTSTRGPARILWRSSGTLTVGGP